MGTPAPTLTHMHALTRTRHPLSRRVPLQSEQRAIKIYQSLSPSASTSARVPPDTTQVRVACFISCYLSARRPGCIARLAVQQHTCICMYVCMYVCMALADPAVDLTLALVRPSRGECTYAPHAPALPARGLSLILT